MRFPAGRFIVGVALLATSVSCVDKKYDMEFLDPEITVMKTGLSYPLTSYKKGLDELFKIDMSSYLRTDAAGNYYLTFKPDPFDISVRVSEDGRLVTDFNARTFTCSLLPDAITGEHPSFGLDYARSEIQLRLDNGIPAPVRLGIDLETFRNSVQERPTYHFGDLAVAPGQNELVIREEKFFNPIPDGVKINALTVSMSPEQEKTLEKGKTYIIHCEPVMRIPVVFVAGAEFHYEFPMGLIYGLAQVRVRSIVVISLITNTIPVDFEASAYCSDKFGNRVPEVTGRVDRNIPAGTLDSPSRTETRASLMTETGSIPDGITVCLKARVPASMDGVPLNKQQGIVLKDNRLLLPEGIQLDLFKTDGR